MAPSDLDLSMHPDADQIGRREFATVRRGYDADQVRDYLTAIAEQVRQLEERLHQERRRADEALAAASAAVSAPAGAVAPTPRADEPDPYDRLAQRLAGLIGTADREAARIVDEARAEATQLQEGARIEADRTRLDAQAQAEQVRSDAERVLREARETSERSLGGLQRQRDELMEEIRAMQERLLSVATGLGEPSAIAQEPVGDAPGHDAQADEPVVDGSIWEASDEPGPAPIEVDLPDLASIDLDFDRDPDQE